MIQHRRLHGATLAKTAGAAGMMSPMEVDPGLAIAKKVPPLLASAQRVRAAGVICEVRDQWLAVHVNLTVLHDGLPDPQPLSLRAEGICAFDVLLRDYELEALARSASLGGVCLLLSCGSVLVPGTSHGSGPLFMPRELARRDWQIDWPCEEVAIQGGGYECDRLRSRFVRFADALQTMEPPIKDKMALCRRLGIVGDLSVDRGGHVYVRRPLPVRLHAVSGTTTVNEIEIAVDAYGRAAEQFTVSVIPHSATLAGRRVHASDFALMPGSPSLRSARVRLTEPGPVSVSLSARPGEVADELETGAPGAPVLIHQQFDPDYRLLRKLLFGPSGRGQKESGEFEKGVAWLLHLCGCAAMHLGRRKSEEDLQGAPDIVARTPGGDVLIGECSLKGPTDGKLGKLLERTRSLAALLQRAGVAGTVRALFFVAEPCDVDLGDAGLIDVSRLKEIVERLREGRCDGVQWL